ncbi:MAG: phosphotransferase [Planctomycetes bacterium]|nr:phosphotransferase [Planctomycetota bacterium]
MTPPKNEVLRDKGGFLSPTIRRIEHEGRPAILKDFRTRNVVTRRILAPALVRREFAILRHLEGIAGIPRAIAIVGGAALVTEFINGRHIGKYKPGELSDEVFRQLAATVAAMHARGVAHLDLRQKKNILVADRPYLIDFANAVRVRAGSPLRAVFARLRQVDESGLLKFKARHWPHLLTDADRDRLRRHRSLRSLWIFSPHTDRARDKVW